MVRPLPFAVLEFISNGGFSRGNQNTFSFGYVKDRNCAAYQEALRVLISVGGVLNRSGDIEFGYYAKYVVAEIINSGCIPDQKSHQYYPTPESIAREAIELADIGPSDSILEPSAGQGGLADFLPVARTTCIELSALHCKILEFKGFDVEQADFLKWAEERKHACSFTRVVMNPPFSEGRWQAHLESAYGLLERGGRLVAVLPASAKNQVSLPGCDLSWSGVYSGEFAGTGVSVVILSVAKHPTKNKTRLEQEEAIA
jgi:hypothetical protein